MGTWKLAEHQTYAVTMMECNPALAVFYEAGTGKTAVALQWVRDALDGGEITDALVVCPASMVGTWEDAVGRMINFEGWTDEDVERLRAAVTVRSYQKVYRTEHKTTTRNGCTYEHRSMHLREDVDKPWGAVIVDESHSIGSHSSRQTKACLTLAKLAAHRYILTGTPVAGGKGREDFSKLYGQLKFLDPGIWRSWTEFCTLYVTQVDHWNKPCAYDVDACRDLMKEHGIVCRLTDCFDMPETTDTVVPCPLEERKVYKDIVQGDLERYGLSVDNAGGQYIKLLQLCSGSIKVDDETTRGFRTSKDDALRDILEGTEDKVVVFCQYRASIDRVKHIGENAGRTVAVFDGRSHGETWREFQYGDADLLVTQYQAGGVGLDLFASATMVFWEPTTSALLLTQSKARIYRKGQTRRCIYRYLVTPGTIEEKVLTTVMRGEDVTNDMLERWSRGED